MRIAFVTGAFPKLSETFVLQQIVALLELGHDVRLFAFEDPAEAVQQPLVAQHRLLERTLYLDEPRAKARSGVRGALAGAVLAPFFPRAALTRRLAYGAQGRFDVIYCHFGHIAELARQLRSVGFFEGPLVAVFHAYDLTTLLRDRGDDFYSQLFAEAALLLPISDAWRQKLVALGAEPERVEVQRMGVDSSAIEYRPRALGPEETPRLASVGRFVEKKGLADGLRAMALAERALGRPLHYELVGDGPLRSTLEHVAATEGIAERVTFYGSRTSDETFELLGRAHLLLAPSVTAENGDMEGIPVVLMEAMAQGLPVISTRHSGIPELVQSDKNGLLVPERDPAALSTAIVELLRDPAHAASLAANARRTIETDFDSAVLARKLEQTFTRLRAEQR